ncbi:hypothetical protein GCK32_010722 [Trichostrongylus colubriformis]|uniref:Phlebovirus glycoprotein G2 fusion domain-containing protein n=2 Tax=Trichostrongylus colubriformis TaxID=6319 RepID=A0AAN8FB35_TRICO
MIVLLCEPDQPRNSWAMGRIVEVRRTGIGTVREVTVELPNKHKIRRPVNHVIPLEIGATMDVGRRTQTEPEMIMEAETTESAEAASCPYNLRKRRQIVMKEGEDDVDDQEDSPSQHKVNLVRRIPWTILTLLTMVQLATANNSYTQEHQLTCIDGGVQLIQNSSYPYDVCTENYCVSFISPRTVESVNFPPQVTLHDYLVKWKIRNGDKTDIMETLCRATAFCPSIECTFCEASIANPECWPRAALIGVGLLLYVSFMICYVIFAVPVVLGRPLLNVVRWIGLLAKVGVKNLFKCSKAMLGCIFTRMRRRRRRRIWSEIAIIITTMAIAVNGCQEVSVFHQHTDLCLRSSSRETCTVDTTEVVKINPFRREACLRLTANDSAITEIRILWKELQLFCEKETVLYTRSTRYATLDSKRCPHVGSCTGDKCASVNRSTLLHELEQANQYPGVTGCTESCGGLGCDCFYTSSGCLFYRIYLIPEDHRIYEFYRCARWKPSAELLVTMSGTKASTQALRLRVSPNEPKQFSWWTLTLSSLGFPPVPALDSTFVTNGIHTALAPRHYQPPLVCQTPKDARSMTCEIVEDCICTPAEIKIRCSCKGINLTSHMQHPDHRLPQLRPNVELREDRDQLLARIPHLPTAEFVLRVRGTFHTTSLVSDAVCTVDITHCFGCYKCAKGAQATVICRSSTEKENAEIRMAPLSEAEKRLQKELRKKIEIVQTAPGRPSEKLIQGKLKYYGDKCYDINDILNDYQNEFINLMADRDTILKRRGGALHFYLKLKLLYKEHEQYRKECTSDLDNFVLAHEWYEILVAADEVEELARLDFLRTLKEEVQLVRTSPGDPGYPNMAEVRRSFDKPDVVPFMKRKLIHVDALLEEEK